jgi:hypothetical protein
LSVIVLSVETTKGAGRFVCVAQYSDRFAQLNLTC